MISMEMQRFPGSRRGRPRPLEIRCHPSSITDSKFGVISATIKQWYTQSEDISHPILCTTNNLSFRKSFDIFADLGCWIFAIIVSHVS